MRADGADRREIPVIFPYTSVKWPELSFVLSLPLALSRSRALSEREVGNPRRRGWERRRRDSDVRSGARCGPVATPARLGIQLTGMRDSRRGALDGFPEI